MRVKLTACAIAILTIATTSTVAAAPPQRRPLCHWDDEAGGYVLLSLVPKAYEAHTARHDDDVAPTGGACPSSTLVFARATSSSGDGPVLIAEIQDHNDDGELSLGDLVVTHKYPGDVDGSTFHEFDVTSHTIDGTVHTATKDEIWVETSDGNDFRFEKLASDEGYSESGTAFAGLFDSSGDNPFSRIYVQLGSPSQPTEAVSDESTSADVVDVAISLTGM